MLAAVARADMEFLVALADLAAERVVKLMIPVLSSAYLQRAQQILAAGAAEEALTLRMALLAAPALSSCLCPLHSTLAPQPAPPP
jgi:DNA-binding FadR family transcriptional regulator